MQAFRRLLDAKGCASFRRIFAGIAQLVEQLICNQQVVGSNPTAGSLLNQRLADSSKKLVWLLINSIPYVSCAARWPSSHAVPHPGVHVSRDKLSRENLSNETTGTGENAVCCGTTI